MRNDDKITTSPANNAVAESQEGQGNTGDGSASIADNEREILAFWRKVELDTELERKAAAMKMENTQAALAFEQQNKQEALAMAREIERLDAAAKRESLKNSFAFQSSALVIFSVAFVGIIFIFLIREWTNLLVKTFEIVFDTLQTPTFSRMALFFVTGVGAVMIVRSVAAAHITHSNNARSVAEKAIEVNGAKGETRLRIEGSNYTSLYTPESRGLMFRRQNWI